MKNPGIGEGEDVCLTSGYNKHRRKKTFIHLSLLNVSIIQYAIRPVSYHAVPHFHLIKLTLQSTGCL